MLSISVSDVLDRAAFYLNDTARNYYTNTVLLEPFKAAYDDLRETLADNGIAIMNDTSAVLTVNAGVTDIGGDTGPKLPINLMVPLSLYERTSGTNNDFALMERRAFLPVITVTTAYLKYWAYQKQVIQLLGATGAVDVKINFIGDNITFADRPEDRINLFNAKSFLSYRTGALAAKFIGEDDERANTLNGEAGRAIELLMGIDIKSQQSTGVVRRPFRGAWKRTGLR
jgi:hypothetical protein